MVNMTIEYDLILMNAKRREYATLTPKRSRQFQTVLRDGIA